MKSIFIFFSSLIFLIAQLAHGQQQSWDRAWSLASHEKLWQDPQWLLLIHYEKGLFGGLKSEADSGFFLSKDGSTDPALEMRATLSAFGESFDPEKEGISSQVNKIIPGDQVRQHPQCRFPARYAWLQEKLNLKNLGMVERPCPRYRNWRHSIEPDSISLVFASYYMSNPASLFGHTFLKLNRKDHEGREILDYGVNYSANVTTDNAFLYALFGITGGFDGSFTNFPYYMKVQEYGNFESRDLWEYVLNLSPKARDRFMAHLWELGHTHFDYFFFKRNCSFYVLALLDAAEPSLGLTKNTSLWVIPSDTVRTIAQKPNLVKNIIYRPSHLNLLAGKREAMSENQSKAFAQLLSLKDSQMPLWNNQTEYAALSEKDKPLVLSSLIDYLHYKKMSQSEDLSPAETLWLKDILLTRSQLGPEPHLEILSPSSSPDQTHGSFRVSGNGGLTENWGAFAEIGIHPAFHDFMAKDLGLPPLSQIELMSTRLRFYPDHHRLRLHELKVVDVISLTSLDPVFPRASWKVNFGLETMRDLGDGAAGGPNIDCTACSRLVLDVGYGAAWTPHRASPYVLYGFLEWETAAADAYNKKFRLGPGASVGGVFSPHKNFRLHGNAAVIKPVLGDTAFSYKATLQGRYSLTQFLDARLELSDFRRDKEVKGSVYFYF